MSDKPLNVSARAEQAATALKEPLLLSTIETVVLASAFATFERDLLEEVKGRIEGLKRKLSVGQASAQFYLAQGHNAALDEAIDALSTLTPESPSNAAEAQAGFAKEKNDVG